METEENNKIIAEFDGYAFYPDDSLNNVKGVFRKDGKMPLRLTDLRYHESWDWLMPVVEKIESMVPNRVVIDNNECRIISGKRFKVHTLVKINSVWQCVVQFITWYSTQSK